MKYLTKILLKELRLDSGETLQLFRHVIWVSDDKSVDVDDEYCTYSKLVSREFNRVSIRPNYDIDSSRAHLATILLAVELVKLIDSQGDL